MPPSSFLPIQSAPVDRLTYRPIQCLFTSDPDTVLTSPVLPVDPAWFADQDDSD